MMVWSTAAPEITAQVDALLAAEFTCAHAAGVLDEQPFLYADTVVFFFADELPPASMLKQFNAIFGPGGTRVHNVIGVAGLECLLSQFHSSAGEQDLFEHLPILEMLQNAMRRLHGQHA